MKTIPLTKGYFTTVDDEDYERLASVRWYVETGNSKYVRPRRNIYKNGKIIKRPFMSRVIMNAKDGEIVDHIDGNTLNNQKNNLRICTIKENSTNRNIGKNNKSGYKGVCWSKAGNKWQSQIKVDGKMKYLGLYKSKHDAAEIYNKAATKYHGKYKSLNKINHED